MEKNLKGWYPRMNSKSKRSESPSTPTLSPKINNLMQCKLVPIRSSMISKQLQLYKFRFNTSYPIFQIHHFSCDPSPPQMILPADTVLAKIVYELPQKRLSDLQRPVNIENSLYILKTVLMGCEKLVQFFGWFKINENMIGFGKDGDCKIWVNEMLEVNEVTIPASCEQDMVESVKKIFIGLLGHDQTQNCLIQLLTQQRHTIIELNKAIWSFSYDFSILIPPQFQNSPKAIHRKTKSQVPSLIKRKSIEMSTNLHVKINEPNRRVSRYKQAVTARDSKQRGKSRSCSRRSQINNKDFSILSKVIKQNSSISFYNKESTSSSMINSEKHSKFNLGNQQYFGNENTVINIAVNSPIDQSQKSSRQSQNSQLSWSEADEKNNSDYHGVIVGEKRNSINFREGSAMVKMNKSSHVQTVGMCTWRKPQKKLNSKSDFICLNVEREQSIKMNEKQNILKDEVQCHKAQVMNARSFFKNLSMNQGFVVVESQNCANPPELSLNPSSISSMIQTDSILTQNPSLQNKKKMKNMIKQKIKQNREKKKVVKLQAIETVKSIGEFTQSQRKILSENSQNETNWNQNLQILQQMCTKVGNSYFHIDMPHVESEEEMEQETTDDKGKIYQNQCYADNSDQIHDSR